MSRTQNKISTQRAYIKAALDVIEEEGVTGLTLRKVASRLNVTPMAIYKHFENKEALLSAALDEFIAQSEVIPDNALPWEDWVCQMAIRMHRALIHEANWIHVLGAIQLGNEAINVTKCYMNKVAECGMEAKEASYLFFLLIQQVIGDAVLHVNLNPDNQKTLTQMGQANDASEQTTHHHETLDTLAHVYSSNSLEKNIRILIKAHTNT